MKVVLHDLGGFWGGEAQIYPRRRKMCQIIYLEHAESLIMLLRF